MYKAWLTAFLGARLIILMWRNKR